jgi:hypothetical protein
MLWPKLEPRILLLEDNSPLVPPIPADPWSGPSPPSTEALELNGRVLELNDRMLALERDMQFAHLPRIAALEQKNDLLSSTTEANFSRIKIFSITIGEGLATVNERIAAMDQQSMETMRHDTLINVKVNAVELRQFYSSQEDTELRLRVSLIEEKYEVFRTLTERFFIFPPAWSLRLLRSLVLNLFLVSTLVTFALMLLQLKTSSALLLHTACKRLFLLLYYLTSPMRHLPLRVFPSLPALMGLVLFLSPILLFLLAWVLSQFRF